MLFGFSFWGYKFVENFAGAIGALDEYWCKTLSISFKLELSFMPVRARENVTSFFFFFFDK